MKTNFPLIICGVMVICSCSKENNVNVSGADFRPQKYTVRLKAEDGEKTVLSGNTIHWESGDKVGVNGPGADNVCSEVRMEKDEAQISFKLNGYGTLNAYYPYNAQGIMEIPVIQNGDFDSMPMCAIPQEISEQTDEELTLQMCNYGSVLDFSITANDLENLKNVTLVSSSTPLAGKFTADTDTKSCNDLSSMYVSTQHSKQENGKYEGQIICAPGTFNGTMEINTSLGHYAIPVAELTLKRSHRRTVNIDLTQKTELRKSSVRDTLHSTCHLSYSGAAYSESQSGEIITLESGGKLSSIEITLASSDGVTLYSGTSSSSCTTKEGKIKKSCTFTFEGEKEFLRIVPEQGAEITRLVVEWN